MQFRSWFSQHLPVQRARSIAATAAVALVHIGIAWMLLTVHQSTWRPHKPRPFQVVFVPAKSAPATAAPNSDTPDRAKPRAHEREPSRAITTPPVPESVFDDWMAQDALRNTPDCSAENLVRLTPDQRGRCARMAGPIARGEDERDFIDPTLRKQFARELAQKGRDEAGPYRTCPPTSRRALMGLACWKGMDN